MMKFVVASVFVTPVASDLGCVANRDADPAAIGDNIGYACAAMPRFDCNTGIIEKCDGDHGDVYTVADYVFSVFYQEMSATAENCSWGGAATLVDQSDWEALGVNSDCVALADPTPPPATDASCAAHPACAGLVGDCCPAEGDVMLYCCGSAPDEPDEPDEPVPVPSKENPALALIEGLSKGLFNDETLSNCIAHVTETVPSVGSSIDGLFKALLTFKPLKIAEAFKNVLGALKDVPQQLQDCGANLQDVKDLLATLEEIVPAVVGEFASAKDSLDQKNYEDFGEHLGKALILMISDEQPNSLQDLKPSGAGNAALQVIIGLSDGLFGDRGLSECFANVLENTAGAKSALGDLTSAIKSKSISKMFKAIKELKQVVKSIPDSMKSCGGNIEAVKGLVETMTKLGSEFVDDSVQAFRSLKAHDFGDFGEYIGKALRIVAFGDEPHTGTVVV